MSEIRLTLAPAGTLMLRLSPDYDLSLALNRAVFRLAWMELSRKRRPKNLEGTMYPDQHNYIASPAQGSTLNAGQFGSIFAQHPCTGCAKVQQAYDAQTPARPLRNRKHAFLTLFKRNPK